MLSNSDPIDECRSKECLICIDKGLLYHISNRIFGLEVRLSNNSQRKISEIQQDLKVQSIILQ